MKVRASVKRSVGIVELFVVTAQYADDGSSVQARLVNVRKGLRFSVEINRIRAL